MDKTQLLSLVIPCYNEEETLPETIRQLEKFQAELQNFDLELVFVDDGSLDQTRNILKKLAAGNPQVRVIGFARNFGHQVAITAGIDASYGDVIVIMDADLQDPPEVIHRMIDKWREGFDVVYGTRTGRPGETSFKRVTAHLFYRFINKLSDIPIPLDTGDFRLITRRVAKVLKNMPERDRFIRGMVTWVGFRQTSLFYERGKRVKGKSKYRLKSILGFALDGILSFSTKPLRISIFLGIVAAVIALVGIVYSIIIRLYTNDWVEGWATLMIGILFMGGVQLISIGIIGEYVGRIYNASKNRPLYIVQEYIGFDIDPEDTLESEKDSRLSADNTGSTFR